MIQIAIQIINSSVPKDCVFVPEFFCDFGRRAFPEPRLRSSAGPVGQLEVGSVRGVGCGSLGFGGNAVNVVNCFDIVGREPAASGETTEN